MRMLITGAWNDAQTHFAELRQMGHEIIWMQDERGELPSGSTDAEGVICNGLFLHHSLDQFPLLRFIQLTSAGFDRVPLDEIKHRDITIHNAKGVYSIPMAEFAIGGVLQLYKQSRFFMQNQQAHRWEKHRGLLELYGKTVCILGTGSVGSECAMRFRAFGCRVLGVNIRPRRVAHFDDVYGFDCLDSVLALSDIVILALPLTEQTRHFINEAHLGEMKLGSILVNLSRGAVVDTDALLQALETNLGGAILDVFEEEPLSASNPLWSLENVLITPHNSFVGDGIRERLYRTIMDNLRLYHQNSE